MFQVVDTLENLRHLESLYINLVNEEEVDYVLRKLARLKYLNGLGVDREELLAAASIEESGIANKLEEND